MARIENVIHGVSTTSAYTEGDCLSLVNLRPKNGALVPVPSPQVTKTLTQSYAIVFVHSGSGYAHWIGVKNSDSGACVFCDITDTPSLITDAIPEKITDVEQTGNMLSLVAETSVYYILYKDGGYSYLGKIPDLPTLHFGAYSSVSLQMPFRNEYKAGSITKENFIEATKGLVNKCMDYLTNGFFDVDGTFKPGQGLQLYDACFVRYAFRLYDGTLLKPSSPILVMPQQDVRRLKEIRYEFDSAGNLIDGYSAGGAWNSPEVSVCGYRMNIQYDDHIQSDWADIIKSVDLFLSPPIGASNIENIRKDIPANHANINIINGIKYWTVLIPFYGMDVLKNVENNSLFYYVGSLSIQADGTFKGNKEFPSSELDITRFDNLVHQERLEESDFSHHGYGASCSYMYNNRLHLANVNTAFYQGHTPDSFIWLNNSMEEYCYNGTIIKNKGVYMSQMLLEVEINTGEEIKKVYRYSTPRTAGMTDMKLCLSAFLSYPDPRAQRMTLYNKDGDRWLRFFSAKLTPHKFMNLAYYIRPDLKGTIRSDFEPVSLPDVSSCAVISESNKLKVSELNNPLFFPSKNTYLVGNGAVLALATNTMNVADRNYGQYPVYVLTTQGIWTLNVGSGEVVYSVLSAPTYPEAPTTGVVCSTPFGVVFTAPSGLMLINGQAVECLSTQLKQNMLPFNMEVPQKAKSLVHLFEHEPFDTYLSRIGAIAYNPHESEIILSQKDAAYNYVLHLPTRQFYMSTHLFDQVVQNVPSSLLVIDKKYQVRDFIAPTAGLVDVSFILRPLRFGTNDIKRLERMILRGNFYGGGTDAPGMAILTYHANDATNFTLTRGMQKGAANYRDLDMGLFACSKWRQFVVSFGGSIDGRSQLFNLDTLLDKEYINTKMR